MSVLYVVLPIALVMASGAIAAFLWAVRSGQMDDLSSPAVRVALEDDAASPGFARAASGSARELEARPQPLEFEARPQPRDADQPPSPALVVSEANAVHS